MEKDNLHFESYIIYWDQMLFLDVAIVIKPLLMFDETIVEHLDIESILFFVKDWNSFFVNSAYTMRHIVSITFSLHL